MAFSTWYRTRDGGADYAFSIERKSNGDHRVYITSQPSYRGRNTSMDATHRLVDSQGYYVCWTRTLNSLEDAKSVAAAWADKTQNYIRTGRRF